MQTDCGYNCLQGRAHIFKIHARSMSVEKDIRYELLARLCPNSTGRQASNKDRVYISCLEIDLVCVTSSI